MLAYGPNSEFFADFAADISKADNRQNPLVDYKWSDALALSASWLLQDMEGCHLIPDQIVDD